MKVAVGSPRPTRPRRSRRRPTRRCRAPRSARRCSAWPRIVETIKVDTKDAQITVEASITNDEIKALKDKAGGVPRHDGRRRRYGWRHGRPPPVEAAPPALRPRPTRPRLRLLPPTEPDGFAGTCDVSADVVDNGGSVQVDRAAFLLFPCSCPTGGEHRGTPCPSPLPCKTSSSCSVQGAAASARSSTCSPGEGESREDFSKRLKYVANAKLLRLVEVGEKIKELGGRSALVTKIAELQGQAKDKDFVASLGKLPLPRLLDTFQSLSRKAKPAKV
jgi:hypothetical protein